MKKEFPWLDSLKGIAMLGVIAVHSGAGALPSVFGRIGTCGKFGVQLFFIISAMLAFASYERNVRENKSAFKWVASKLLYLLPFFYLMVFLSLIITGGCEGYYANDTSVTIWNVIAHLTLTMGLFPKYANSILGIEWYLGVLVIFFVLVPVLYRMIRSKTAALIGIIVSTLLFDLIDKYTGLLIPVNANEHVYTLFWGQFSIFPNLPVLLTGVFLYFLFRDEGEERENAEDNRILSIALIGIFLIMAVGLVLDANRLLLIPYTVIWAAGFALLMIAQSYHSWVILDNPLFRLIGKNTYCIYLSHYLMVFLYDRFMMSTGNVIADWIIKYIIITAISLVISLVFTKAVDRPYKRFCDRILRK